VGNQQLTEASAEAAAALLALLDDDQRARATATFADETARRDWHYVPRARRGLALADMSAVQQKAAISLLRTGLSASSFATACLVMALEDVLDDREHGRGPRRGKTGPWGRHRAEYHAIVFGDPSDDAWGWRFEGHHVSVTITVVDGEIADTPHFLGANPASVPDAYRLLAPEQDLAFALLAAMADDERAAAIVSGIAPDDILTTNQPRLDALPPDEGVVVGDLGEGARSAANDLVSHYDRRRRLHAVRDVDRLRFAFAGEPIDGRGHYYRIQGADLLIEYDNTQDGANHIHTVVRDPARDFGDDLLRRHLADHH
jgi:hypothetical protein